MESFHRRFWKFTVKFFFNSKICYRVLSGARGCYFSSRLGSFIQTFTTRWPIIMVLLFNMKQILILGRIFFVELIYLSNDLKTINCQTWRFFVFSLKICVCALSPSSAPLVGSYTSLLLQSRWLCVLRISLLFHLFIAVQLTR